MAELKEKPAWLQEWVWDEYVEYFGAPADGKICKLIFDQDCKSVWETIERHEKRGELRMSLRFVLGTASGASSGPFEVQRATAAERRKTGDNIAKLAASLRKEVLSLSEKPGAAFGSAYHEVFHECSGSIPVYQKEYWQSAGVHYPPEVVDDIRKAVEIGFLWALNRECPALIAIERSGKRWAESKPFAHHPHGPGADLTYFAREMTGLFLRLFDTPLRASTATLASCLFDRIIEPSHISHIAPLDGAY